MENIESFKDRGGWWVVAQFCLLVIALWLPTWDGASAFYNPLHPIRLIGLLLLLAGMGLLGFAIVTLGPSLTPFPKPRAGATLHTDGLYGWMRHPIYAAIILVASGWALSLMSALGVAFVLLLLIFFDQKARHEERLLREQFPDYDAYAQRVPRFVPRIC